MRRIWRALRLASLDMSSELVAEQVKAILRLRGMRPADLARALGKDQVWVSRRLKGQRDIGVDELAGIAAALGAQLHIELTVR